MTRAAYGLDKIRCIGYNATTTATTGALAAGCTDHGQHPASGPEPYFCRVLPSWSSTGPYYQFPQTLNVDRYDG